MSDYLDEFRKKYPDKFAPENQVFKHVRRGARIFVGTGCGEPQYLVRALVRYVQEHPNAFYDAEVIQIWTLGVAPYIDQKFKSNFRHNSFFIGNHTRKAVNTGMADYTPVFLSQVPDLFHHGLLPVDIALIQTSLPDRYGNLSLGISVDIVKAATQSAGLVIAQANSNMPWVHGDSFINMEDVDFILPEDEPLLEYQPETDSNTARRIGDYVARLIQDGDTIQIGYGSIPNAILSSLSDKKHLGVHTELLSDGMVELMKNGVIDNTKKSIDRDQTVATFCMGSRDTYAFIDNNPSISFRPVNYTNNPLVIARHDNMTAVNSALEIDLTGQATAESIGRAFFSGIGGQADFMRGAVLARNGKTILTLPATGRGGQVSRIVPLLEQGAGVTLNRGDVHYVVTEYGIAYLHGKNIRERAMELISIAHPEFRSWLVDEAKKHNLIFKDQAVVPGEGGIYPDHLETYRTTKTGLEIMLRPVKMSDEPLLKQFFYSLSDESIYRRFISMRTHMAHEQLQKFVIIDYRKDMAILAVIKRPEKEEVVGIGQYFVDQANHTADVAFAVKDKYQNMGIGWQLISYLSYIAKKQGILGFTTTVLKDNKPMLHLNEKMGFNIEKYSSDSVYELKMMFN